MAENSDMTYVIDRTMKVAQNSNLMSVYGNELPKRIKSMAENAWTEAYYQWEGAKVGRRFKNYTVSVLLKNVMDGITIQEIDLKTVKKMIKGRCKVQCYDGKWGVDNKLIAVEDNGRLLVPDTFDMNPELVLNSLGIPIYHK
jgi:hypothetical protein